MRPPAGEAAFVLAGETGVPIERLALLKGLITIGVDLAGAFEPTVRFDAPGARWTAQKAAAAARWARALGCRPVCLLGVDLAGPGAADLLDLLAAGQAWLWQYRGGTFERMVAQQRNW